MKIIIFFRVILNGETCLLENSTLETFLQTYADVSLKHLTFYVQLCYHFHMLHLVDSKRNVVVLVTASD